MNQSLLAAQVAGVMSLARRSGLAISLCTIRCPARAFDDNGVDGPPVDVLVDIACMDAPLGFGAGMDANERKTVDTSIATGVRHVWLANYYPQIPLDNQGWSAVVDGQAYDMLGSESDSQRSQTRLKLQVAGI